MFKISGDNNSRMSLMPLATIRLTPPKKDPLRWASLCGLWLLSGCATIAPGSAVTDVEFIVQGKLLLTLAQEKTALQFSWQQNQDDYVIDVSVKDERNCAALGKNAGYEGAESDCCGAARTSDATTVGLEYASRGDALLDSGTASAEYPLCRLRH